MYDRLIVSVIIPAYNAGASLADAVTSALRQRAPDIDVVIVDDNSTDNTLDIARRYESEDERVRVLANDRNVGPGESRNRAIASTRGDWIALLDADDRWLPERLERLSVLFAGADVVSDDVVIEEPGKRTRTLLASNGLRVSEPRALEPADVARHGLGLLQPVVRREFLLEHEIRFDPSLRIGEDFCFLVDLLLAGARWLQVGEAYYVYRRRPGSVTSGRRDHIQGRLASDTALLERPGLQAEPELRRLIQDRVRWLRDFDRLLSVVELARAREWRALAGELRSDPRLAPVVARTAARHGYHEARRRVRR